MKPKYDQVQIFRAWSNGADREIKRPNSWKMPFYNHGWYRGEIYRIANKTADGINFHDFIEQVKDDCSNVLMHATCPGYLSEVVFNNKSELVEYLIVKPEQIKDFSLKKEPKYRACEIPNEALEFVGAHFNDDKGNYVGLVIGTDTGDFILVTKNHHFYLGWKTAFEFYKTDTGKTIGVKRDGADS